MRTRDKKTHTCPNTACKRDFETPLRTLNLQQESAEPYDACPFCLTEIAIPQLEKDNKLEKTTSVSSKDKSSKNKEKSYACQYHMGYLSEREQKQPIPDECIVCKDIVECMLKKIRAQ